jgi:hypothetical protein
MLRNNWLDYSPNFIKIWRSVAQPTRPLALRAHVLPRVLATISSLVVKALWPVIARTVSIDRAPEGDAGEAENGVALGVLTHSERIRKLLLPCVKLYTYRALCNLRYCCRCLCQVSLECHQHVKLIQEVRCYFLNYRLVDRNGATRLWAPDSRHLDLLIHHTKLDVPVYIIEAEIMPTVESSHLRGLPFDHTDPAVLILPAAI